MSPRKTKKKPAFNLEAFFERVAEKVDPDTDMASAIEREPWPEWQNKLAGLMARSYSPELKGEDFKKRPWVFDGYGAAAQFLLAKKAETVDYNAIPKSEMLAEIRRRYEGQGILETCSPEAIYEFVKSNFDQTRRELDGLYATLSDAARKPILQAVEFFEAFGDGLKRRTGFEAIKRLGDNNTVKICWFIISTRALVEAGVFLTISELIAYYHFQLDRKGETFSPNQENSREAFDKQFRRICSKAGLKLAGRGRPRGGSF